MTNYLRLTEEKQIVLVEFTQGEDIEIDLQFLDDNEDPEILTGYEARMQVKESPTSTAIISLASTGVSPAIIITGSTGSVGISIPNAQTETLRLQRAYSDLLLISPAPDLKKSYPVTFEFRINPRFTI